MSDDSSTSSSESENDSEYNYISNYVIEDERQQDRISESDSDDYDCYKDEPLADDEWIAQYNEHIKKQKERNGELARRLGRTEAIDSW